MTMFKVDIEKVLGGEYWTNRYLVNAASLEDAAVTAAGLVDAERPLHLPSVLFTKRRVSDMAPDTSEFIVTPLNLNGTRTGTSGEVLALFNTLRVDFPAGFGRPSRKYFRGCLTEADINGANIAGSSLSYMQGKVNLFAVLPLVDPQGALLGLGVAKSALQMRQIRRGTRRRAQPII